MFWHWFRIPVLKRTLLVSLVGELPLVILRLIWEVGILIVVAVGSVVLILLQIVVMVNVQLGVRSHGGGVRFLVNGSLGHIGVCFTDRVGHRLDNITSAKIFLRRLRIRQVVHSDGKKDIEQDVVTTDEQKDEVNAHKQTEALKHKDC